MFRPYISAPSLKYRPDIDGLRALAILPVVFYHFRVPPFSGGFVGVDIFFVISGYLITSLITDEMRAGHFSILRFYERRIRRIFPALFLVLAGVSCAAFLILFPTDLQRYAMSLIATAGFASNFHFLSTAGYFDAAAETKPLLHTWSLAVEEQFYLVFPALLYLVGRYMVGGASRRNLLLIVAGVFVASLAGGIVGLRYAPLSTFYLLPFRMWELMLGAMLAIGQFRRPASRAAKEGIALLGLGSIAWSVFSLTTDTPFPGENALAPCIGAALLIYANAGGETAASRLLSMPPIVFIGLISYSLYLWHWPLLVFARYATLRDLTPVETSALILASGLLATLSWAYVEKPFRSRDRVGRKTVFQFAGAAVAAAVIFGTIDAYGQGFPWRFAPEIREILAASLDRDPALARCFDPSLDAVRTRRLCRIGAENGSEPSFVVWGDSHADALLPVIVDAEREKGRSGYDAATPSCPPLAGVTVSRFPGCLAFNDEVLKLAMDPKIDEVVLVGLWAYYTEGIPYGKANASELILTDDRSRAASRAENRAVFARSLERTVAALSHAGKRVVIVASVPEVGVLVPETLARIRLAGTKKDIRPTLEDYFLRQGFAFDQFAAMHAKFGAIILNPHRILCGITVCEVVEGGRLLYRDENHLTSFGARKLLPLFRAEL